ncbi:hypothetical protein ILUMI_05052 [Ignelater luminosus]|uniref:Protein Asterix n=1 Tax=Ignelater luminosus TaxID=2038154 RepID=A0A8K0D805_IGNLU|nr:hypothetical protein ILUMI_05052 [Ignelater luminosus]
MIPGNVDPRRPDKVQRYKPPASGNGNAPGEDLTPDYMNILGTLSMIFSMLGITMRLKWCSWLSLYCCCINFANSRVSDDAGNQIFNPFVFGIIAVVMPYLQNPQPMTPPWNYLFATSQ